MKLDEFRDKYHHYSLYHKHSYHLQKFPPASIIIFFCDKNTYNLLGNFWSGGVPVVAQRVKNTTSIHKDVGSILGPSQWLKDLALLQVVADAAWISVAGVVE